MPPILDWIAAASDSVYVSIRNIVASKGDLTSKDSRSTEAKKPQQRHVDKSREKRGQHLEERENRAPWVVEHVITACPATLSDCERACIVRESFQVRPESGFVENAV